MTHDPIETRFKSEDAVWGGPRFHALLAITLAIAIAIIYSIASVRSGDFVWHFLAHDPGHEIRPSTW